MAMTKQEFADRAILVPFEEKGRSWGGWDCWGIPYLGFREVLGIQLPEMTGKYSSTRRLKELRILIDRNKGTEWVSVDEPRAMDCVILLMMGESCHIGLMLDEVHVLHVEANCMTIVERIDQPPWRGTGYDKVEGFYRHASQL